MKMTAWCITSPCTMMHGSRVAQQLFLFYERWRRRYAIAVALRVPVDIPCRATGSC